MKRFKKARSVWLGREPHRLAPAYAIGLRKSDWNEEWGFRRGEIARFCTEEFESVTGIRLEPGEVVKVKIIVEEA